MCVCVSVCVQVEVTYDGGVYSFNRVADNLCNQAKEQVAAAINDYLNNLPQRHTDQTRVA